MASAGRIDVHNHSIPTAYRAAAMAAAATPVQGRFPDWSPELALQVMDKHGIQAGVMSVTYPGTRFCKTRKGAKAIARQFNEYAAELISRRPDRFGVAFGREHIDEVRSAANVYLLF